ncbi:hypothetical protein ACIBK8_25860 [Streptomyces sp. NPDC050161]|uniref:hypothetical protein n=1 Tax=Streptomyces sp. NPDC050161 TaxID=3365604 RepID=UPI0037A08CB6
MDGDVMGVITAHIENRFGMTLTELQQAVADAPHAHREAANVVHWHGLLRESQSALEKAEDDLVAALDTQTGELDDPAMGLAHRVNAAVAARDGRALVVTYLLDPDAPGKQGPGARRGAAPAARRGPALQTSQPARPASPPASTPVRGVTR